MYIIINNTLETHYRDTIKYRQLQNRQVEYPSTQQLFLDKVPSDVSGTLLKLDFDQKMKITMEYGITGDDIIYSQKYFSIVRLREPRKRSANSSVRNSSADCRVTRAHYYSYGRHL